MARVSGTGRLNVVVTREGSLSPRSRSESASPNRGSHHHIEQQLPQQRRAESLQNEVKALSGYLSIGGDEAKAWRETAFSFSKAKEKCTELQAKVKTAKRLLDASRVESARLSRLVEVKSRKLHAARKEAARVPVLAAEVGRLREVTGNTESALGKEGKRAEEEQRRSEAWRARVDKLSLQARLGGAEHCRTLSAENHQLKEVIERMREHLEEAKRRCSAAGATSNALRLKTIETELLSEELGAVRADCGRLVQLVSSTKEYAEFRRVWDDSGGLTRPFNGGAETPFFAAKNGVSISHGVITKAKASQEEETTKSAVSFSEAAPFSGGMPQTTITTTEGPAAAERGTPITRSSDPWEQAMRSEWSSPSEKLIGAATEAAAPPPPPPPPPPPSRPLSSASTQVAPTAGGGAASSAKERTLAGRGSRPEGAPGRPTESPPPTRKKVSFSGQAAAPPVAAGGGREVYHGVGRGLGGSPMCGTGLGMTTPAVGVGAVNGHRGGEGGDGGAKVVRWGRVDLLSVLYPPRPTTFPSGAGASPSGTNPDPNTETSMWVPRDAAGLCRRFVQDLNGYSGLPLDAEQHRLLWGLLLGLNACWRLSERRHVERLRTRYRAELAAAHRRLHMSKPLEEVVGERAAERRRSSQPLTTYSNVAAAGALAAKTAAGGHGRVTTHWGTDGRRIRKGGEESGRRSGTACATACSRSCMSSTITSSGRPQPDKEVAKRLKRTKGRGCRRAVFDKCQRKSKVGGGDVMPSSATLSASNASAGADGIDNVLRAAAPVGSAGRERYASDGAAATAAVATAATVAETDAVAHRSYGTEYAWRTSSTDNGGTSHLARYSDFFDQYEDALLAEDRSDRDVDKTVTTGQHARTASAEGEEERHRDETTACSGATSSASPREASAGSERRTGGDERQKQGTGGRRAEGAWARHIEQQQRTSSGFSQREARPPSTPIAPFHTRTRLGHASFHPSAPPNIDP
ncbi:unnamed protein product [Ectocarpus sp. 13 AM-2016]